jgi:hypothetical protein
MDGDSMTINPGFYKFDNELLSYAATSVYAPNYTLLAENHVTIAFPINGWFWFNSQSEAESYFGINGTTAARWLEFGAALAQDPAMNMFFRELDEQATILYGMLTVGMGQASEGKPRTFLAAWSLAMARGLIPADLQQHLISMASGYDLPQRFIDGLQPQSPQPDA